ncbi:MAG: AAA family ATPase [Tissierellia bacterium]|nr:AAA family ATPase [Bacillota bacterium]NLL23531.1 AAA family ATPase [Tissierellia bacterium]
MLLELSIRNFILIEDIHLSFSPGFSVITGETGAGKSILLEGIRIALGSPASKSNLRLPDEKASFELVLETDNEILSILRELFPSGKSLSRLQGVVTTLPQIRSSLAPMLDIYAQKEDSLLLHPSSQRDVLDRFSEGKADFLLSEIEKIYRQDEEILREKQKWAERASLDTRSIKFERDELKSLHLDPEADAQTEREFSELKNLEERMRLLQRAVDASSTQNLVELENVLETLGDDFREYLERTESLRLELEDISYSVQTHMAKLEEMPYRAAQIEERYAELFAAKRKYRLELPELYERLQDLEKILDEQESIESTIEKLDERREEGYRRYLHISSELSEVRRTSFYELRSQMIPLLEQIQLKGAEIDIKFEPIRDGRIHLKGDERLEMLASINRGPLKPFSQVLSGGELSRFMLALKAVFGKDDTTRTMIFDEIDAGISGKTAYEAGKLLKKLSKDKQIIAITHQPHIVSFADHHYHIEKTGSSTQIKALNDKEHLHRLALMLSPVISESAVRHAEEMIRQAKEDE